MDRIKIDAELPKPWVDLLEALTILAMHPNNDISPLQCSHDTLSVMADPHKFTTVELLRLAGLGFYPDEWGMGFQSSRFGSA